jgi:Skp family chaperone for outer membrane proteins
MVEVTVRVPEDIKDIIAETSETIYVEALKDVARKRTSNIQRRLKELRIKNAAYERKYGKSYAEFSQNVVETPIR